MRYNIPRMIVGTQKNTVIITKNIRIMTQKHLIHSTEYKGNTVSEVYR